MAFLCGLFIPGRYWPGSPASFTPSNPSSNHTTTLMMYLPEQIQKQIPDAVLRKLDSMDESAQLAFAEEFKRKKKSPALAFWLLLPCGMHYAYVGRVWLTLIFLMTFGGFGMWWFIDLFRVCGMVREHNRSIAIQVLRDIQVLN